MKKKKKILDPNNLFDFIKILFTDEDEFNKVSNYTKGRQMFMINRFMSMQQPVRANYLQYHNINPAEVVNFWQWMMKIQYEGSVPGWIYTKTAKKKKQKKNKFVKEETLIRYCEQFQYSRKQIDEAINFFGDDFIEELIKYEKLIEQ